MAKIAIITDTHFGTNNNSQRRLKYQLDYLEREFFPVLKDLDITQIFHLGDFWHSRKEINPNTYHWVKKRFLDVLAKERITMHIVPGNHDMYFTGVSDVTSITVLQEYKNIKIYRTPSILQIGGIEMSLVPWISNKEEVYQLDKFIKDVPHKFMFGHFEITDFFVTRQMLQTFGYHNKEYFKNFEHVYSGHYHIRQEQDNITYLGTPYELNWNDYNEEKGFNVFDTDTKKMSFYKNLDKLHIKVHYNDVTKTVEQMDEEIQKLPGKFVRILVESNNKESPFQEFLQKIERIGCENVTISEAVKEEAEPVEGGETAIKFSDDKNICKFLKDYVDVKLNVSKEHKEKVIRILEKSYNDTVSGDVEEETTV